MELTLDEALQKGIEAHKAGQIQETERLYTAMLKAQPNHHYPITEALDELAKF